MSCFNEIRILDEGCGTGTPNPAKVLALATLSIQCFPGTDHNYIRNHMKNPNQRLIQMFDEKKNVYIGFCFLQQIEQNEVLIHTVCINNSYKNQKCCFRLFLFLVQNYGKYNLRLEVRTGKNPNIGACKCYSRFGFIIPEAGEINRVDLVQGIMTTMVRYNRPVPTRSLTLFEGCDWKRVVESSSKTIHPNQINVRGLNEIKIGTLFNHRFVWRRQKDNTWLWCVDLK